jgi:hypothetical protein
MRKGITLRVQATLWRFRIAELLQQLDGEVNDGGLLTGSWRRLHCHIKTPHQSRVRGDELEVGVAEKTGCVFDLYLDVVRLQIVLSPLAARLRRADKVRRE